MTIRWKINNLDHFFVCTRLTGEALFPGKKFNDVLRKNKACKFNIDSETYDNVDPLARNLLKKLLEVDPNKRITASQALLDPYFSQKISQTFKKAPSFEDTTSSQETQDVLVPRDKQVSMYIPKQKVPYAHKNHSNNKIQQDGPDEDNYTNGSFITKDVLFVGAKKETHNGNDVLIT